MIWNHQWLWKRLPKMNDPHFCTGCGRRYNIDDVRKIEEER